MDDTTRKMFGETQNALQAILAALRAINVRLGIIEHEVFGSIEEIQEQLDFAVANSESLAQVLPFEGNESGD